MTVEWKDICPRCEAVHEMPDDGSADHVCEDRKDFLSVLWTRRNNLRMEEFVRRMMAGPSILAMRSRLLARAMITGEALSVTDEQLTEAINRDLEAQYQHLTGRFRS